MNTTTLIVLLTLALLNVCSVGVYHFNWKKSGKNWNTPAFYTSTVGLLLFGVCYLLMVLFNKIRK